MSNIQAVFEIKTLELSDSNMLIEYFTEFGLQKLFCMGHCSGTCQR